jgi:penicillin-binding protein 1A
VIDNHNAGIKAMVGGPDFDTTPFNLATQGHRQPGSSIKPFTLLTALEEGISPETVYESAPQEFHFGKKGEETFVVHNDEDSYLGSCSIICATTYSDNSIYAQLGLEGLKGKTIEDRTRSIARTIHKAGYADPISTNPAMVLGGLKNGVTPVGWAYAYTTIGNNGDRVSGTLAPRPGDSPVSYTKVTDKAGNTIKGGDNDSTHKQVIKESTAEEAKSILETVVSSGTGTHAQIGAEGEWGKTGTTEENVDAWFCGGISNEVTACVWVGYADSATPMKTLYSGGPVMGGTFPALIWASVMSAWEEIKEAHAAEKEARKAAKEAGEKFVPGETEPYVPSEGEYEVAPEGEEVAPLPEEGGAGGETEAPAEAAPEVTPEAAPEGGGGGGGVTAG